MARSRQVLASAMLAAAAVSLAGCGNSLTSQFAPTESSIAPGLSADLGAGSTPTAQLPQGAETLASVGTPGSSAYKIGPLDVIEMSVFKVPELSRVVQVTDAGTINLPLVGDVSAAGRTSQDLEKDLVKRYGGKYLQSPQVSIYIKEYNSQRVTIEGAVKKPGVYPIRGKGTLLQFIATADGLDPNADATVVVFRTNDNKRSAAKFDLGSIRSGQTPDPSIQSGDVIIAGSSAIKEVFNNLVKAMPIAGVFTLL